MKYILTILLFFTMLIVKGQQEVELCPGSRNSFTYWSSASTAGGGWLWVLDRDTISTNSSVRITWRDTGFYVIRVIYNGECGQPEKTYKVKVIRCPESAIFFPNAFTPNNDGLNDGWSPIPFKIIEIRWQIWNRYGQKVFETVHVEEQWDGLFKGQPQPMGGYVFQCWWKGIDGKTGYKKGNIVLIR